LFFSPHAIKSQTVSFYRKPAASSHSEARPPGPESWECLGRDEMVVVALELGEYGAQVPFTLDQQMVKALSA